MTRRPYRVLLRCGRCGGTTVVALSETHIEQPTLEHDPACPLLARLRGRPTLVCLHTCATPCHGRNGPTPAAEAPPFSRGDRARARGEDAIFRTGQRQ